MAKSSKHKAARKKEKTKTQLKGSKTLAKAQNVVEPKLKSRKILIREQLKSSQVSSAASASHIDFGNETGSQVSFTTQVLTRRKQSLKEVLAALNHHNKNIRRDAVAGLIEIVSCQSELLVANLDRILEKIGDLTLDVEGIVRKENLRASEIIFTQLTEAQVKPFWKILLAHVKRSLTSLNPSIRYGCLSFVALLVSYFPNLVSSSNTIVLPVLLSLISTTPTTMTTKVQPGSKHNGNQKSKLKVDISDGHNGSKERLRVLSLIAACLDLSKTVENSSTNKNLQNEYNHDCYNPSKFYFPYGYQEFLPANESSLAPVPVDTLAKLYNNGDLNFQRNTSKATDDVWSRFIQSFAPVLWETWLEVGPSLKGSKKENPSLDFLSEQKIFKEGWDKVTSIWNSLEFSNEKKFDLKSAQRTISQILLNK